MEDISTTNQYGLSAFYHRIQRNVFGERNIIHIHDGRIFNKPVYLEISDLDLLYDLSNILEFYKKIDTSDGFNISISECDEINASDTCSICNTMDDDTLCPNFVDDVLNIYEWIPIGAFLENRNPSSELYHRKIAYNEIGVCDDFDMNKMIILKLIHQDVDYNLDEKSTMLGHTIFTVCDHYNLSQYIENKICDKVNVKRVKKSNKIYRNVII